jgi:hypothetical protein
VYKSVFLNIRLAPDDKERIKAKAVETGVSAAELIRCAVLERPLKGRGRVPAEALERLDIAIDRLEGLSGNPPAGNPADLNRLLADLHAVRVHLE